MTVVHPIVNNRLPCTAISVHRTMPHVYCQSKTGGFLEIHLFTTVRLALYPIKPYILLFLLLLERVSSEVREKDYSVYQDNDSRHAEQPSTGETLRVDLRRTHAPNINGNRSNSLALAFRFGVRRLYRLRKRADISRIWDWNNSERLYTIQTYTGF